jgi:hypothetical protein
VRHHITDGGKVCGGPSSGNSEQGSSAAANALAVIGPRYAPFTFAQLSRNVTVRLNTGHASLKSATSFTK